MSDRFGNISISDGEQKEPSDSTPPPRRSKSGKNSPPTVSSRKSSRKWLLFLLIPALLFGVYCGVGFYLVPAFITEKLPAIIEKKYKIQTSVDSTTFNPLDFTLTLQNLSIKHDTKDALGAELLSIDNINLTLSPLSLIRTNFVCENIIVDKPKIRLIRYQDGSYNISKYIDTKKKTSPSEIMDFAELPFLFSLNNVSISDGQILFKDKPSNKTHTVEKLSLGIPTLSNFLYETEKLVTPHFSAVVNGSPLEILSQPSDISNSSTTNSTDSFTIELENFNLPQYIEYLPFSLPLQISNGIGKGKINLSFTSKDTKEEKLTIQFQLQLDDITTNSKDKSFITHITSSQLLGTYYPVTNELSFDNIYIQEPVTTLSESFSRESIYRTFFKNPDSSSAAQRHTPDTTVFVRRMLVDGGSLSTVKNTDDSPKGEWNEIKFTLKDFINTSPNKNEAKTRGNFRLSGEQQDSRATFIWDGKIDSKGQPTGNLKLQNTPASTICNSLWQDAATCSTGTASFAGTLTILSPTTTTDNIHNSLNYSLKDTEIELEKVRFTEKDKVWLYAEKTKLFIKDYGNNTTAIDELSIIGANIHLHQYFVPKLISKYTEKDGTPLTLNTININGTLTVHNSNNATPLIIENFSAKSIDGSQKNNQHNLHVSGSTPNNGTITAKGTVQFSPLRCSFSTEFENIASEQLLPLFSKNPIAIKSKTNLNGKGMYSYPQSSFLGSVQTDQTELISTDTLLNWERANFTDVSYKKQPFHFGVKRIDIQTPSFTWSRKIDSASPYDNLSSFFNGLLPTNNFSKKRQLEKAPYYQIDQINIFQGNISLTNERSPNSSTQLITEITGNFSDIIAPISTNETSFIFTGNNNNTPFSFSGKGDLLTFPSNGKATYTFSNVAQANVLDANSKDPFFLKDFSTKGIVNSEWFDNQTINNIEVSIEGLLPQDPASTEALALAFLYKENPYFKLQFEQKTSSETPSIPLLEAGIANFKTRLIKSQISPLLLAEDDYSDLIGVASLPFEAGSATLTGETMELLSRFSSLLTSYPLLALTLQGQLNIIEDKKSLYDALFETEQQRIVTENDRLFKEWQDEAAKVSAKNENSVNLDSDEEIIEEDLDEPIIHQFIPLTPKPVSVPNIMLSTLATQRAKAAYDFLVSQIGVPVEQLQVKDFNSAQKELLHDTNVKISLTTSFSSQPTPEDIDPVSNNSDQ